MKKIGIITFHNSYNCGSMLESYAMQTIIEKQGKKAEIIDFSNYGQRRLYGIWHKNNSIKNIARNILLIPAYNRLKYNNKMYEKFKNDNFKLSKEYTEMSQLSDEEYDVVVSGSDQIWNITISDADDAYFLPWVRNAKKVAYAPSFGSKNIMKYSDNPSKYINYLKDYDALSIREKNGRNWIYDMIGENVQVLLDPTLLLDRKDYDKLIDIDYRINYKYIFFYSPDFDIEICKYVKKVAKKYNLKVITWSTKPYYRKLIKRFGFILPIFENPTMYLYLIKNAELIFTTSFHGTIFSTIYKKKFFTIKNGGMYGDDDRVITLLSQLEMMDRLIPYVYDKDFDYFCDINYKPYEKKLSKLRKEAIEFINRNVVVK